MRSTKLIIGCGVHDTWNFYSLSFFQTNESFFLVPKPLRNVKDSEKFWRIDFHKIEATILKGFSKVIIKFLKVEKVIKKLYNIGNNRLTKLSIYVTPLPFSPVQFQYNWHSTKETNRSSHSDTKKLDHFTTCNIIV